MAHRAGVKVCASCAWALWLLASSTNYAGVEPPPGKPTEARREHLESQIAHWIEQLGDPQYHARENAQEELRRLGALAFDALLAAQDHPDIEIAMRARYLVRSVPIAWTKDTDPTELKQLFKDYSARDRGERKTRAKHFATLDDSTAIAALCRIMRFDPDRLMSKEAAALILNKEWPETEAGRMRRAELIRAEVVASKRPGSEWLLLYARTLDAPAATAAEWEQTTRDELELLARHPQQTDRALARDLVRWHTQLLLRVGRAEQALASIRRTFDLLGDDRQELYDLLDWSIEQGLHGIADELAARFVIQFQNDPQLLYRLAESQLKQSRREAAEATAQQARQLFPDNLPQHTEVAVTLHKRLLTEWAEAEFRHIVERTQPAEELGARIRFGIAMRGDAFAEILFDLGRESEAAELVKVVVEAAAKNPQVYEFVGKDASELRGYMNYYYGMHHARLGDREKQMEYFRLAIAEMPSNPDCLIAMYRVPNADEAWRADVKKRMEAYAGGVRQQIRDEEATLRQPLDSDDRAQYFDVANKLNELAWLISNTEGDVQEALASSKKSLEYFPDYPAYMDTLGRCYFAAGDVENAIKVQSRAVKRMPWMYVMRRQLAQFEEALAKSRPQPSKPSTSEK